MKKGIGVGIEDFKKIIEEDCYYFDKTNYIEELLKDRTEIKLFTRPRRFGKTLNMTTLKYFFDSNYINILLDLIENCHSLHLLLSTKFYQTPLSHSHLKFLL